MELNFLKYNNFDFNNPKSFPLRHYPGNCLFWTYSDEFLLLLSIFDIDYVDTANPGQNER